jgi:hypothetical protein
LHDLEYFRLADMVESGKEIRRLVAGAGNMEAAAGEIVDFFYGALLGLSLRNGAMPLCGASRRMPSGSCRQDCRSR